MDVGVVFMGSPDFALPTLRMLAKKYRIIGVVTQPNRPAGRGRLLTPPPVKNLAIELGLEVIQPAKLREPEATEKLETWKPDVIVVAAYGQILRQNVLDLPRFGCINVHASLLPRWRGAAPIQAAIAAGDKVTGVTIMKMDAGIDTGHILARAEVEIRLEDTALTLSDRLAERGATLLAKSLPEYLAGHLILKPQDETKATRAPMLKKEDGLLDFNLTAEALARLVRAYNPWPGAYFYWNDELIKVHKAHPFGVEPESPGKETQVSGKPALGTSQGWFVLDEIQPAGKKSMPGEVFLHGARQWGKN
jgi:methionyl-tRNA formyltransferase